MSERNKKETRGGAKTGEKEEDRECEWERKHKNINMI